MRADIALIEKNALQSKRYGMCGTEVDTDDLLEMIACLKAGEACRAALEKAEAEVESLRAQLADGAYTALMRTE